MSTAILSKIEAIAERVAQPEGIEIVEVELKGGGRNRFLRISIDKPEGVTHGDCELISQQVGTTSSTSRIVPTCCEISSQSPWVTPSGLSMEILKNRFFPPPFSSISTISIPSDWA